MEEVKNEVDVELAAAQEALAAAQKRKADAMEAARLKAAADLARSLADEQQRLARLRKESEEASERGRQKRIAAEAAHKAEQDARDAETRRLEAELEERNEVLRKEEARKERIRKVEAAAFVAEQEAASIEASLLQASAPKTEETPVTLQSTSHPLSRIFNPNATEAVVQEDKSLDSVAVANAEARKKLAQHEAQPVASEWRIVRKSGGNRFVSSSTSYLIEQEIKRPFKMTANPHKCDLLSADYEEADILEAVRQVAQDTQGRPTSHDFVFLRINTLLEEASKSERNQ